MKRTLSILMTLLLLWSLALPAAAAETATAATLRLEKTEGTVNVSNASGKSVTVTDGMRLYSGYTITTEKSSYAYVSLDSTKAVKLDASSKVEVQKSGKKLELSLISGELFFNVTAPLEKDENLNIRTSTMVTGVRGTSGWVEVTNRFTSRVNLLEGTLTVTSSEPATGQMRQATITSGQTATATLKGLAQAGRQMSLTVTNLQEKQVPGFVAVEVEKDPALQQKIAAKSRLSVPAIIGDAWDRLENEQKSAAEEDQKIQKDLNKIAADEVDQVFESPAVEEDDDDDDDDEPYVPPTAPETPPTESETSPSITLDDPSADELTAALGQSGVDEIIVNAGTKSADTTIGLGTASYEVPAGQTLTLASGTFTVGASQTLTVKGTFSNSSTVNVEGTLAVNGSAENNGTVTVLSMSSLDIAGAMTNNGTITVGEVNLPGSLCIAETGKLENSSKGTVSICQDKTSKLTNEKGGTFNNYGNFSVPSNQFICRGDYNDYRDGLYAMAYETSGGYVFSVDLAENISDWYGNSTIKLLGTGSGTLTVPEKPITYTGDSGITLDLNGHTAALNASLNIGEQGSDAAPSLTITDSSSGKTGVLTTPVVGETEQGFDTILVYSGTLTLNGGTVTSTKGFPINVRGGMVNISGGEVSSQLGTTMIVDDGGTVNISNNGTVCDNSGSEDGAAIRVIGQGEVDITGGAVESSKGIGVAAAAGIVKISGAGSVTGGSYGILVNDAAVEISGGTVTLTAENPATLKLFTVSGPFTFSGGTLRAKELNCFCNIEPSNASVNSSDVKDSEGYYTATPVR